MLVTDIGTPPEDTNEKGQPLPYKEPPKGLLLTCANQAEAVQAPISERSVRLDS